VSFFSVFVSVPDVVSVPAGEVYAAEEELPPPALPQAAIDASIAMVRTMLKIFFMFVPPVLLY